LLLELWAVEAAALLQSWLERDALQGVLLTSFE